MILADFSPLLEQSLTRRTALFEILHKENTNTYRLFHGIAEGSPGLTIDRYGSLILVQTFREPLSPEEFDIIQTSLHHQLPYPFTLAYNHRGKISRQSFDDWHRPSSEALEEIQCTEFGIPLFIRARHIGLDPWLFLDLRVGRRYLRDQVQGRSVLNLFAYTGSIGICAALAGAKEVWNVDFAASSLAVAKRNAELNSIPENCFHLIEEDCWPVMRQLAGLPVGGRKSQKLHYKKFSPRQFDLVFLDPPAWAKGPFGAIDVVGDYPSLFKTAALTTTVGGQVIATNHVASVDLDAWINTLKRCADKAGRPIRSLQVLTPETDFPSFDGRHPLKIAVCTV
jgi:23S rRNA (cytosine1962-C5)-methyltransferase